MKYIVVTNPGTYDCAVSKFDTKEAALIYYDELAGYGSRPILARVLDVKLVADEEEDECYTT